MSDAAFHAEHERLRARTLELAEEHRQLESLPFDRSAHRKHRADLREHIEHTQRHLAHIRDESGR